MAFCQRDGLRIPILQAPPVGSCQLVKRLERGEPCQGGQVAAEPPALGEVERPERSQPCQRGQVALELLAPREVERLE
jgi:hypothetical protein